MTLELLISAVKAEPEKLIQTMQLTSDAVLINQCDHVGYEELPVGDTAKVRVWSFCEKGVGLSRNNALMRAQADLCLFSDEDIVYEPAYEEKILAAFAAHPAADMILFNVEVCPERRTYEIKEEGWVHQYNCGRYPAYSMAVRRKVLHDKNVTFSLLFGGGAAYSNGEDSLFIRDCIARGMKVYRVPVTIGREIPRPSTWFSGYHEKFFRDRGVLYEHLYGPLAKLIAWRFLLKHRAVICREIPVRQAYRLMCEGLAEARSHR